MLRRKVKMIHQAHRLLETRMERGTGKVGRQQCSQPIHQIETRRTELFQDLGQQPGIVISLMSFAVGQVGDGKSIATRKEVVHARHPQRLEIQKMAGVFLGAGALWAAVLALRASGLAATRRPAVDRSPAVPAQAPVEPVAVGR